MQIDPCCFCGEPALERYALLRVDTAAMRRDRMVLPVCEPHRQWLYAAGDIGRATPDGLRWILALP